MAISSDERLAVLRDIQREWLELTRALRGLSDNDLEQATLANGWTLKVLLGHIAAWERKLIEEIAHLERGEPFTEPDVEAFNAEHAAADAGRRAAEIREELERTHAALMEVLERTPLLSRELVAADTYRHYPEHTEQIKDWRAQHQKRR